MTWERFGYLCRKAAVTCGEREVVSDCLARIEQEAVCGLYGAEMATNSWPRRILDKIGALANREAAVAALTLYGRLKLTRPADELMKFKGITSYLLAIALVYFVVVAIYQLKVAPTFVNAFTNLEVQVPALLVYYRDYWGWLVALVAAVLMAALLVGHRLQQMFQFQAGIEQSPVFKYLLFSNTRVSYLRLIELLQAPLHMYGGPAPGDTAIARHLLAIKTTPMDLATEIEALIAGELRQLLECGQAQMKALTVIVAGLLAASVFIFLFSAYAPLFMLGDAV
ncbi:hypothetical protein [Halioxenophilus sp. WMMB6]|uniref:hypothetical protein n=1 Tax=Halioxenophilus sp. WMMB6 TaxID=3073815 RepID=UPI00295E89DA|nr:hypothetical protein [Halioxenophilus sp. WMMB6]